MNPAIISALIAAIGPALTAMNKGGKEAQWASPYTQQQQAATNQFLGGIPQGQQDITKAPTYQTGVGYLQDLFSNPDFFNKFEAPLQRQFREDTIPNLVNQFAGMGSGGSFGSGFQNAAAREARSLQESIAALRGNMMQQNVPNLLNYAQQPTANVMNQFAQGTGHPLNTAYMPATPGPLGEVGATLTGATSGSWGDIISNILKGSGSNSPANQSNSQVGLGSAYDNQFRANPSMMGY